MPERDRSLPTPSQNRATIFKRLMLGKQSPRTRDAYAADLRDFARFLGINSYQDVHPLTTIPYSAWQQLDTARVAAHLKQLKQSVSPKTGQPYSTATLSPKILDAPQYSVIFENNNFTTEAI